jgi:Domain of unknown function (DUF6438)
VEEYGAQITSISLERGACFGSCPIYKVTLRSDGTATYDGERFVDRIGEYQAQIDLNDYSRLAGFVERAGFLEWNDEYVNENITDLPNYYLTVVADGATKTVHQYGVDEPPDFWVIAALVDFLADRTDWTSVA